MSRPRILISATIGACVAWIAACGDGSTDPVPPPSPPEPPRATAVFVSPPRAELTAVGETLQLAVQVRDQNGQVMDGVTVTWSTGSPAVATVDASGLVTAVGDGAATISATAGSATGNSEITVDQPDRAALVALYEATDGPNWIDATNWLSDAPLNEWYGVESTEGHVWAVDLTRNNLSGTIPPELGSLTHLNGLDLRLNDLTGPIPPELGGLPNLYSLVLDGNDLTGPIPPELGNLASLGILSLWGTNLSGSIPPELGNLTNVWYLRLIQTGLSGPIPPELGNMAGLSLLRLDRNDLTGPIPPELANLANLTELVLSRNELTGPIPRELANLSNLEQLGLGANRLTGPIPSELGGLANLKFLNLSANGLTGPIPTELRNLAQLTELYLFDNDFTGAFPAFLLGLPDLMRLFLGAGFCAPADPGVRARLETMETDLAPCHDPTVRRLPSALMREDGNGLSLALPDDFRTPAAVTISDSSVVAASSADGWLTLSPLGTGSADVTILPAAGGDSAVAYVEVRDAVGTFGIDIVVDQPVPFGYGRAMTRGADWWSDILDGTEWPDREAGCPNGDPFGGKVRALADEILVATRIEELTRSAGYADGCFFPAGGGRDAPALDPGGGYVVMGGFPSQGLVRHEIGHLLGLVSWRSEEGLATSDCEYFTGPKAVEAFRAGGGDPDLPGVPIQTNCGSHWHEDIVGYEVMGPYGGWDANSISLGALVDAGYTVDLSKALPWPRGSGAAARTAAAEVRRDIVLGEPRIFVERRPRRPPR